MGVVGAWRQEIISKLFLFSFVLTNNICQPMSFFYWSFSCRTLQYKTISSIVPLGSAVRLAPWASVSSGLLTQVTWFIPVSVLVSENNYIRFRLRICYGRSTQSWLNWGSKSFISPWNVYYKLVLKQKVYFEILCTFIRFDTVHAPIRNNRICDFEPSTWPAWDFWIEREGRQRYSCRR